MLGDQPCIPACCTCVQARRELLGINQPCVPACCTCVQARVALNICACAQAAAERKHCAATLPLFFVMAPRHDCHENALGDPQCCQQLACDNWRQWDCDSLLNMNAKKNRRFPVFFVMNALGDPQCCQQLACDSWREWDCGSLLNSDCRCVRVAG